MLPRRVHVYLSFRASSRRTFLSPWHLGHVAQVRAADPNRLILPVPPHLGQTFQGCQRACANHATNAMSTAIATAETNMGVVTPCDHGPGFRAGELTGTV